MSQGVLVSKEMVPMKVIENLKFGMPGQIFEGWTLLEVEKKMWPGGIMCGIMEMRIKLISPSGEEVVVNGRGRPICPNCGRS